MWYEGTKEQLKSVICWLESTDEGGWDDQIDMVEVCIADMDQMARPVYRQDKSAGFGQEPPKENPVLPNLNRATPEVQAMLRAMQDRDRAEALKHGRAALAEL
jgi:hypothetical protein